MGLLLIIPVCSIIIIGVIWVFSNYTRKASSVKNKHAIITGGSSGIGKCCAVELAKRGANITLIARDKAKLALAKVEVESHIIDKSSQIVNVVSLDISGDYDIIEKEMKKAEEKLGPIFILLNCAGFAVASRLEDTSIKTMKELLDVNFVGSFCCTKAVLPSMKRNKGGHIAFTSSQAGLLGVYGYAAYSGAKFALRGLAETLQMEVKPYNIRVTLAFPPDTDTPGFIEEEKTKPEETRLISETSHLVSPDSVAQTMIEDILLGKFFSSVGLVGTLVSTLCAGLSPVTSTIELIFQVFSMGFLRLLSALLLFHFDQIVEKCRRNKITDSTKDK